MTTSTTYTAPPPQRAQVHITPSYRDTGLSATYTFQPLSNLVYTRDQQITTCKVGLGPPHAPEGCALGWSQAMHRVHVWAPGNALGMHVGSRPRLAGRTAWLLGPGQWR